MGFEVVSVQVSTWVSNAAVSQLSKTGCEGLCEWLGSDSLGLSLNCSLGNCYIWWVVFSSQWSFSSWYFSRRSCEKSASALVMDWQQNQLAFLGESDPNFPWEKYFVTTKCKNKNKIVCWRQPCGNTSAIIRHRAARSSRWMILESNCLSLMTIGEPIAYLLSLPQNQLRNTTFAGSLPFAAAVTLKYGHGQWLN